MNFKDKTVCVTGAASGIGAAIAEGFASEGANVALLDINERCAEELAQSFTEKYGVKCIALSVDVSDSQSVAAAFEKIESTFTTIDILVTSAGISIIVPMTECTEEIWDRTIDINLKGTFLCMQSAVRIMEKQKSGAIVCMSSQSGRVGGSQYQAYCASKFGIIGLVQSAAHEFAKSGIRVNAICPGVVLTPLWDAQVTSYAKKRGITPEEVMPYFASKIPMGRIGELEEVVAVTKFLASSDASYLTGQSINVSGGAVM